MEQLIGDVDLRFVFVGGKGGVGKTTSSASLATCFSQRNRFNRVLLISTDPAHSLGDAFQREFPKGSPTAVSATLDVLEVDPQGTLEEELQEWTRLMEEGGIAEAASSMGEFQEWLRQIPGIDEATAISNVIGFIEEDKYDVVVFDTAPTGHTLKLLQLPKILSQGMEKLQSWSTTLWTYWDVLQGGGSAVDTKHQMESRLLEYKAAMDKVGMMLKDHYRTQFVTVCIAEYLSVMETKRLMEELTEQGVRSGIQKYVNMLEQVPGVKCIVRVELQEREITGNAGLGHFAALLLNGSPAQHVQTFTRLESEPNQGRGILYPELQEDPSKKIFPIGLTVEVFGLGKTPQYNGVLGTVKSYDEQTQRYGVFVEHIPTQMSIKKLLALKPSNLRVPGTGTGTSCSATTSAASSGGGFMGSSSAGSTPGRSSLLEDAEVKEFIKNPKMWNAFMDVKKDPNRIKHYLEDEEIAEMLAVMGRKIQNHQRACGA
eukprot:g2096.t1